MNTTILKYFSLIKFSHTIFALPFALIGFTIGVIDKNKIATSIGNNEYILKFILVILCMVFARSAAMAFNRYLDANYDIKNPRTAIREIPSGLITKSNAMLFTIICSISFILSTFFINSLCFYLSFVALFVILFYSYTKRFTPLCHLVLGLGLSLAPIGAYLSVTGYLFSFTPILFSVVVLFWVSGFDIIYALQDEDFDRQQNLLSIPVWLGTKNALNLARVFHTIAAIILIFIGLNIETNYYWIGAFIFIFALIYQHTLVKPNDLSKVNMAFFTTNGIASVLFGILTIASLILKYLNE